MHICIMEAITDTLATTNNNMTWSNKTYQDDTFCRTRTATCKTVYAA